MTSEMLARAIASQKNMSKEKALMYFSVVLDMAKIYEEYAKEKATLKGFIDFFSEMKTVTEQI